MYLYVSFQKYSCSYMGINTIVAIAGVLIMQVVIKESQQEAYGKNTMEYFVDVNTHLPT